MLSGVSRVRISIVVAELLWSLRRHFEIIKPVDDFFQMDLKLVLFPWKGLVLTASVRFVLVFFGF